MSAIWAHSATWGRLRNLGLVNSRKILLRQYSGMLHIILKNQVQQTSNTSLNPKSELFLYTDEITDHKVSCGLIKIKMAIEIINPQLVVDHAIKEKELEALTLAACGMNAHTYLTSLQEKQNELNANLTKGEEYPVRQFNTNMFVQLKKASCDDFLTNVKESELR